MQASLATDTIDCLRCPGDLTILTPSQSQGSASDVKKVNPADRARIAKAPAETALQTAAVTVSGRQGLAVRCGGGSCRRARGVRPCRP